MSQSLVFKDSTPRFLSITNTFLNLRVRMELPTRMKPNLMIKIHM